MGAVFAAGAANGNIATATPAAIARGMHLSFALSTGLIMLCLVISSGSHALTHRKLCASSAP
jgi:hypothetical protein